VPAEDFYGYLRAWKHLKACAQRRREVQADLIAGHSNMRLDLADRHE
jgi:hypothetical protein